MSKLPKVQVIKVEMDPRVPLSLTKERQRRDIREFTRLLDENASEQAVHEFLAVHSYFFNRLIRMEGDSPVYSKVKLGNDYEVDFVCFDTGSTGPEWYLIEIEKPGLTLFTRSGDPSAALTHAIQQIQDWQSWIQKNLAYAGQLMPLIEYPLGCIFMGRRRDLSQADRERLRRLCYERRQFLEIHSLDWFIDSARGVIRGGWGIPIKALSHSDLKRGLPPDALRFMQLFDKGGITAGRYPTEMLEDREGKYQWLRAKEI